MKIGRVGSPRHPTMGGALGVPIVGSATEPLPKTVLA